MIRIALIGIYVTLCFEIYAQNEYLLIQKKGSIDILSVNDNKTIHLINSGGELKGYQVDGDSLFIFVSDQSNGGSLNEYRVHNPVSLHQFENPIEVKSFQNRNEFLFGNFSLQENTELILYQDKTLLWRKDLKPRDFMGLQMEKYYYYDFSVLLKENKLLCVKSKLQWSSDEKSVIEIDLLSGDEKIISKDCSDPVYSPLGKYILLRESWARTKQKRFITFSRNENKIVDYPNLYDQAYWLYK